MNEEGGIVRWGVAIPRRSLPNEAVSAAWNQPGLKGSRRIACHDEDAITLGVQAALQAMEGKDIDPSEVDLLLFATTTAPFSETSCAAVIADTLGLRSEVRCLDINSSHRAGTMALAMASDVIRGGSARYALVVAADTRLARPGGPEESVYGQGGVALLLGRAKDAVAKILHYVNVKDTTLDAWRKPESEFLHFGDVRFSRETYAHLMQSVLTSMLTTLSTKPADLGRMIVYSPDPKSGVKLLKKNGLDVRVQYCDLVSAKIGLTGTPHALLMLVAALEESKADEKLIVLNYGDGADGTALQVCGRGERTSFSDAVSWGYDISYNHYLKLKQLHVGSKVEDPAFASEVMAERSKQLWRGLRARRCLSCETVVTLPLPTCPRCRKATEFAEYPLQRRGTVFAVTHEHYFPTPEAPLGMATVQLDGGGRLTLQVADEEKRLVIGDRVELVFRRLHDAQRHPNYFWKCRAISEASGKKQGEQR